MLLLLQSQATRPVRNFTIGFENEEYDESASAEAVAKHLGTEHTTCKLSEIDVLELISGLPKCTTSLLQTPLNCQQRLSRK